jgi:hypothetical protein
MEAMTQIMDKKAWIQYVNQANITLIKFNLAPILEMARLYNQQHI